MTRKEKRIAIKKEPNMLIELLKTYKKIFGNIDELIEKITDPRHEGYIKYDKAVVFVVAIMKCLTGIESVRQMTEKFNTDECIKNIGNLLNIELDELPHYNTINNCFKEIETDELLEVIHGMVYKLIRSKKYYDFRIEESKSKLKSNKYWMVIVDGTHLASYNKKHCEHDLVTIHNKGKEDEYRTYSHKVLDAKIVLDDDIVISICTEFIENESEEVTKQDCEINAAKRLFKRLKEYFPRLPICLMGDSLYAAEPIFNICDEYGWKYLIRFKDGRIPSLAKEYYDICEIPEGAIIKQFKDRPNDEIKIVKEISYNERLVNIFEEIICDEKTKEIQKYKWITDLDVKLANIAKIASQARKRWLIENKGFNIQKNQREFITHANSQDYNAQKVYYLIAQISEIIIQLYEMCRSKANRVKRTIKNISSTLLNVLTGTIIEEDIYIKSSRILTT